jgi:hypothetical protein
MRLASHYHTAHGPTPVVKLHGQHMQRALGRCRGGQARLPCHVQARDVTTAIKLHEVNADCAPRGVPSKFALSGPARQVLLAQTTEVL